MPNMILISNEYDPVEVDVINPVQFFTDEGYPPVNGTALIVPFGEFEDYHIEQLVVLSTSGSYPLSSSLNSLENFNFYGPVLIACSSDDGTGFKDLPDEFVYQFLEDINSYGEYELDGAIFRLE